ncbi:MAG: hypothetical protein WC881_03500 [Elusimicrobiota bacterium]|jgi:hypothetical protein
MPIPPFFLAVLAAALFGAATPASKLLLEGFSPIRIGYLMLSYPTGG